MANDRSNIWPDRYFEGRRATFRAWLAVLPTLEVVAVENRLLIGELLFSNGAHCGMFVSSMNGTLFSAETSFEDDIETLAGSSGRPLESPVRRGVGDDWRKVWVDVDSDDLSAAGEARKDK